MVAQSEWSRAFLQGALHGLLLKGKEEGDFLLKVREIVQEMDDNGVYLPYFTVVTFSGTRIRVTVEVEDDQEN